MDGYFNFVVSAAGELQDGPDGWFVELAGATYTLTHNGGVRIVPTLTAIQAPSETGPQPLATAQLTEVGVNSFSWFVSQDGAGIVPCATAVAALPPPSYFDTP